jgi:hypothetical protein
VNRLDWAYAQALARLRAIVDARVRAAYGELDPDAISESFAAFAAKAVPLIVAGQQTAQRLAEGYLRALVINGTGRPFELATPSPAVGVTREGRSILDGLAAIPAMVLGRIGAEATTDEALEFGRYLVERFTDAEVLDAADRTIAAQAQRAPVVGWNGVVEPDACDPCNELNSGFHTMDTPIYRHGACQCAMEIVFAAP